MTFTGALSLHCTVSEFISICLESAKTFPRLHEWGGGAKALVESANTVPRDPTGGAGMKLLLESAKAVQCEVRLHYVRYRLGIG